MTTRKRKLKYWLFKLLGIFISCAFPIWAICEKFPIWTLSHGTARSVGAGGILILIVLVVVFRKTVFNFLSEKLNLKHAPPLVVWLIMIIISYVLVYISNFISDLTIVFWMGLIGCAIGTALTYIAENRFGKEKVDE